MLNASEMQVQVKWMRKWNASFSDFASASPGDYTNANEMPPGAYNDLANIAAWLEKFSEQAVVTRVNLVGNLVGCLSYIGEVDEDRPFRRAKESITSELE